MCPCSMVGATPVAELFCEEDVDNNAYATFPTSPADGQPRPGKCLPGYAPDPNTPERTCELSGVWSETSGACQRMLALAWACSGPHSTS